MLESFDCHKGVGPNSPQPRPDKKKSLARVHLADLIPEIEQGCIPVDVFGGDATHIPIPSLNHGMEIVDVVEMVHLVIVLLARDHLAVAAQLLDELVVRGAGVGPYVGPLLDVWQ